MKLSKTNKQDWDLIPRGALNKFFGEFDKFFDGFWSDTSLYNFWKETYPVNVSYEIAEDKGGYTATLVEVALAGVDRSRVKVSVTSQRGANYLNIKVDKKEEDYRPEVYRGMTNKQWQASYSISENHDESKIETELVDGLLKIRIPFKKSERVSEEKTERLIEIR